MELQPLAARAVPRRRPHGLHRRRPAARWRAASSRGRWSRSTSPAAGRPRRSGCRRPGAMPQDVKLSPDGTRLLRRRHERRRRLDDRTAHTPRRRVPSTPAPAPTGSTRAATPRCLYVSNRGAGTVSVIGFASRRIVATWHDSRRHARHGRRLGRRQRPVALRPLRAEVYAIDTRTGRLRARIPVGTAHTASASGHSPAATRSGTPAFCAEKTIAQNGTRRSGRVQGREPSLTACLLSASSRRS